MPAARLRNSGERALSGREYALKNKTHFALHFTNVIARKQLRHP